MSIEVKGLEVPETIILSWVTLSCVWTEVREVGKTLLAVNG